MLSLDKCLLCPRKCGADRSKGQKGFCGVSGNEIYGARASLHFWEEPCISGKNGAGTVFFSGCNLKCVYCQNYSISNAEVGRPVTVEALSEIFIELMEKGAENIDLVTPTHYALHIARAIELAREKGMSLPIVYNCGGYESTETLKMLEGLIDIYLTDFKYIKAETAEKYSKAPDYPDAVKKALAEMVRQHPSPVFNDDGIMQKGVIVRHLLLPGHIREGRDIVKYVYDTYGNNVYLSLMNQYTPLENVTGYSEINRRVTKREYNSLVNYAIETGVENAFIQEGETAKESFIPAFDYEGWK